MCLNQTTNLQAAADSCVILLINIFENKEPRRRVFVREAAGDTFEGSHPGTDGRRGRRGGQAIRHEAYYIFKQMFFSFEDENEKNVIC